MNCALAGELILADRVNAKFRASILDFSGDGGTAGRGRHDEAAPSVPTRGRLSVRDATAATGDRRSRRAKRLER